MIMPIQTVGILSPGDMGQAIAPANTYNRSTSNT